MKSALKLRDINSTVGSRLTPMRNRIWTQIKDHASVSILLTADFMSLDGIRNTRRQVHVAATGLEEDTAW